MHAQRTSLLIFAAEMIRAARSVPLVRRLGAGLGGRTTSEVEGWLESSTPSVEFNPTWRSDPSGRRV